MAPRSEDPVLITRAITFELVQPMCPPYINVTDLLTDRQQWRRYVVAKQCKCTTSLLPCTASCTACILKTQIGIGDTDTITFL